MKQFTYTRTALASLLTLCSFGGFAADFSDESIKKQESAVTSGKMEVMKTSNKKLKEKMDRICNADPKKKAEELKKKEEAKLAIETKTVNKNIEEKGKASPVVSVGGVDIIDTNQGANGLRITFGGVVDAQGYGKAGPGGEEYKPYNVMPGRSESYYSNIENQSRRANPIFPKELGNIGDYSENIGMISDAILHLRAENKNEDLGLLYGADLQFHVPVTESKGASQGVNAARGRNAHVFLNSKYGDLKLGYQFGPEALMRLDATRIATVDGAADSDWFRKVNLEGSAATFPFYVTPRLYTESFSSESEKLSFRMAGKYNKDVLTTLPFRIAYYSPNYMGARFGMSYSPRYDSSLFVVKENNSMTHVGPDYEHIVSAGTSCEYDFSKNNIKVKTSVVGEYGQAKEPNKDKHLYKEFVEYNDLMGVNLGISADYKINADQGVKLAASFAYLGKSGQPKDIKIKGSNDYGQIPEKNPQNPNQDNPDYARIIGLKAQFDGDDKNTMYWTAGAGYQYESLYTSLTYFGSKMSDGDKLHDVALGVQYDLSPACSKSKFVPYAALHYFTTDEKQADSYKITKEDSNEVAPSNKGVLFLTGVKFSF
ncbi:MAG: porin [Wolbachia sp.]